MDLVDEIPRISLEIAYFWLNLYKFESWEITG